MANSALNIDSNSEYLSVSNPTALQITGDMTLEIWYRPSGQPASGATFPLISKYNTTGNQRSYYMAYTRPGAGGVRQLTLSLSSDGITDTTKSVNAFTDNGVYGHFAISYVASTGTATFYKDGAQIGSPQTGLPTSIFNSTADFQIMGYNGANGLFIGLIDEARVWNVARTGAQILANYNTHISPTSTGLVAYYRFNDNFNDYTSNANHLTPNGNISFTLSAPFDAITNQSKSSDPTWTLQSRNSTSWNSVGATIQGGQGMGVLGLTYANALAKPSTSWSNIIKN